MKRMTKRCLLYTSLREGIAQQDAGAHILDVNVGLPDIDEVKMMREAVTELQSCLLYTSIEYLVHLKKTKGDACIASKVDIRATADAAFETLTKA